MKVRDRFTGSSINLPDSVESGRYELTAPEAKFNGHLSLKAGDLLIDDGSVDCKLSDRDHFFKIFEKSADDRARLELVTKAVLTIRGVCEENNENPPSPLLPREITALAELLPLENKLIEVLANGHLQEIARAPRLDMQYQESMTHVSRARRLALNAERKLESDTSCWQQRTLSGVIPREILALFSNDDYRIYENRLYVRLIDRLERRLVLRLSAVKIILDNLEESQDYDSSSQYYRLRNDICKIWGETFDKSQTLAQIKMSKHAVNIIERLLRAVRSLKDSLLYAAIPSSMRVPDQIHMTNILTHDQHYRYIVPLWKGELELAVKAKISPAEQCKKNKDNLEAYIDYVGMLLMRALRQLSMNSVTVQHGFDVKRDKNEWIVSNIIGESLVFVPMIDSAGELNHPVYNNKEKRFPVFLLGQYSGFDPLTMINGGETATNIVLTPLDFLVEEKVVTLLKAWYLQRIYSNYGKEIIQVPSKVCQFISRLNSFVVSGSKVSITCPVDTKIVNSLYSILANHTGENIRLEFKGRIDELNVLSICQNCGNHGRFDALNARSFKVTCDQCKLKWGVFTENGIRKASISLVGNELDRFDQVGRWQMELLI